MLVVRETTVWDGDYPNHIYILSDDKSKMLAYVRAGTDEYKVFKKPIGFDTRGRKFEVMQKVDKKKDPTIRKVIGSKGEEYTVNDEDKTCTCPGYTYRGTCKHISVDKMAV